MSLSKTLVISALSITMIGCGHLQGAQVAFNVNLGAPPVCPYGYFDYAPYNCAPFGYYGPDWFDGGVFIGTGPWFAGPHGFIGHVDNRFDPRHGYKGPLPARGAQQFDNFHGNEARDGKGHVVKGEHPATNEHALPGYHGGDSHGENYGVNHR